MDIAILGLGRMGANMVRRLLLDDHRVVAWNRSPEAVEEARGHGAVGADTIDEVIQHLSTPRVVWMMVPAGDATNDLIDTVLPKLDSGDVLIDGGNANWKESVARAEKVQKTSVHYMDAGVSGGVWGFEVGYCTMIGGPDEAFRIVEPALKTLAPEDGYKHVGGNGAGHFAKMIHNGIEYGMMQAYAEGFEILQHSPYDFDMAEVAQLWNNGSVIRSWLLELAERAFREDPKLDSIRGYVEDSGEGRWTIMQSIEESVPAPVLALSLMMRFRSRQDDSFSAKVNAALRQQFGGHAVKSSD